LPALTFAFKKDFLNKPKTGSKQVLNL